MQRGTRPLWVLLLAVLAGVPVRAEEPALFPAPAPNQHQQPLFLSAHPSLFTIPDASRAFEYDVYPAEEFLPPEAYEAAPSEKSTPDVVEPDQKLQLIQYPTIDSGARDEEPVGHYAEPKWNPFPFLTEQLAALPKDQRGLVMKEISFTDTVLPQRGGDYGMNTLDVRSTFYFGQLPVLTFAPRFGWHVISDGGPVGLPSQLFDAGLDASLYLPLTKQWSFLGMVGPSIFTDGENTSSDAFRMTGRALAFYQWSDTVKLAGGFLYLGRADIKAMPAGGVFYQPRENLKVELFFPRPKVAYRISHQETSERWCYLVGEFGGNSWAIEGAPGVNQIVTLRDYRMIAGYEQIHGKDYRFLVEAGFVFGRRIEYNPGGDLTQSPTGILRGGIAF